MTVAPRSASQPDTSDLPVAILPVNPSTGGRVEFMIDWFRWYPPPTFKLGSGGRSGMMIFGGGGAGAPRRFNDCRNGVD